MDCARHEVTRLKAISRKLSELRLAAIKNETDVLQVLVSAMEWKLRHQHPPLSELSGNDPKEHESRTPAAGKVSALTPPSSPREARQASLKQRPAGHVEVAFFVDGVRFLRQ